MLSKTQIRVLFQLAIAMEEGVNKIEQEFNSQNSIGLEKAKKFVLDSKKEIDKILGVK